MIRSIILSACICLFFINPLFARPKEAPPYLGEGRDYGLFFPDLTRHQHIIQYFEFGMIVRRRNLPIMIYRYGQEDLDNWTKEGGCLLKHCQVK